MEKTKVNLGSVATLQRGFDLPSSKRIAGDIPIVSSGGISGAHNESKVSAPGVVTGRYGSMGEFYYLEENFWPLNTTLWIKDFHGNNPKYVYYLLSSLNFDKFSAKTGVPGVNRNDLHKIKVSYIEPEKQNFVVDALEQWDSAIEKTEALIDAKERQFGWLVRRLIHNHNENRITERLGNVASMSSGGTPRSTINEYYGGQIPWVSIADMTEKGMWISSTRRTLTQAGLENSSAKIYPKNTVLYAMYASIGECSIANVELASSQAILGIIPKAEKLHHEYLYYYLSSLKEKIKLQGQWGTQSNLNAGIVKSFKMLLPALDEQKQIAHTLNTAQQEITLLKKLADQYRTQKRGLMQKLLSGEWHIKNKEAA